MCHNRDVATTTELEDLLAQARTRPGVAEVMRVYGATQQALGEVVGLRAASRVVYATGANLPR